MIFQQALTDTNTHGEKRHNKSRKSGPPVGSASLADQPKKTFMRFSRIIIRADPSLKEGGS